MKKTIIAGSRPSPLAIKQVNEIKSLLPNIDIRAVVVHTKGDKDKITSLINQPDSDFFTFELEQALLKGQIDVAVHSAKDMEQNMPQGIAIAAMTSSISRLECLVSKNNFTLENLPKASRIGTSSQKRRDAILRFRPDLKIKDMRGNIGERLKQLDDNKFDAIVVAHAAMIRLGYQDRITQIIPEEIIEPHPLQGRLAVQVLETRQDLLDIFRSIDER